MTTRRRTYVQNSMTWTVAAVQTCANPSARRNVTPLLNRTTTYNDKVWEGLDLEAVKARECSELEEF